MQHWSCASGGHHETPANRRKTAAVAPGAAVVAGPNGGRAANLAELSQSHRKQPKARHGARAAATCREVQDRDRELFNRRRRPADRRSDGGAVGPRLRGARRQGHRRSRSGGELAERRSRTAGALPLASHRTRQRGELGRGNRRERFRCAAVRRGLRIHPAAFEPFSRA